MNQAWSLLDAGLRDMLDVAGQTIIVANRPVRAVVSSVELQDQFMTGGHNQTKGISAAVRKADLRGSRPTVGNMITSDGTDYQIVRIDDEGPGYTITASTPSL
jgi:hypothetical protein